MITGIENYFPYCCNTIIIFTQDRSSGDKPQPKTESKKTYNSPLEESANSHVGANEDTGVVKHTVLSEESDLNLESESWKTGTPVPILIIHYFRLDNNHFTATVT